MAEFEVRVILGVAADNGSGAAELVQSWLDRIEDEDDGEQLAYLGHRGIKITEVAP